MKLIRCIRFLALALAPLTACSAPTSCPSLSSSYDNVRYSSSVSGMAELTRAGQSSAFAVTAHFDHLPELWPTNGAISEVQFAVGVKAQYESEPLGSDGKTQMPRISGAIDGIRIDTSDSFPGSNGSQFATQLRAECTSESQVGCCPFGATECDRVIRVTLTRVEGDPFPPVQLSWSAGASTQFYACPGSASDANITLSNEAP